MSKFKRAGGLAAALAGAFALLLGGLTAPSWAGGSDSPSPGPDEPAVCEGSPEVLGHEWQQQRRTRDLVPAVEEQSHLVYAYKKKVEEFKTEYRVAKFVRTKSKTWTEGTPEVKEVWAEFSPNKSKKPFQGPPTWPDDPRGTWDVKGKIPPGHAGPDGVYRKGQGNGSWFYRQNGKAEVPGGWSEWSDFGEWTKWLPEQHVYWRSTPDPSGTPQRHAEWQEGNTRFYREWQIRHDGTTRQVPDGFTWEYSGEVTEPRDKPWVLLPGYPRKEVTQEAEPETYTEWSEWADHGDVVRTDEQVEPDLPADTDLIEHRWVYVGTYVRIEAVPPSWQDTDPEGDCYTGPTPEPEPSPEPSPGPSPDPDPRDEESSDPDPDPEPEREREVLFKHKTCDGVFERYVLWEYPADGGEPIVIEHGDEKVRDLTVKEAERLGCIETPPPPKEEPKEEVPVLAETGVNPLVAILTALGMAGTGAALLVARNRKREGLR